MIFENIDLKFIVGDLLVPILLFVVGCFTGGAVERHKNKARIKGDHNIIVQDSTIRK